MVNVKPVRPILIDEVFHSIHVLIPLFYKHLIMLIIIDSLVKLFIFIYFNLTYNIFYKYIFYIFYIYFNIKYANKQF